MHGNVVIVFKADLGTWYMCRTRFPVSSRFATGSGPDPSALVTGWTSTNRCHLTCTKGLFLTTKPFIFRYPPHQMGTKFRYITWYNLGLDSFKIQLKMDLNPPCRLRMWWSRLSSAAATTPCALSSVRGQSTPGQMKILWDYVYSCVKPFLLSP